MGLSLLLGLASLGSKETKGSGNYFIVWDRSVEKVMLYLVINLDGTYSDNENETKRLRSNSGLNSRNADSLSNQNRSSGRIRQVLIIDYSCILEADFPRSSKHVLSAVNLK